MNRYSAGSAFQNDVGHVMLLRFYTPCMISTYAKEPNEQLVLASFLRKKICMLINQTCYLASVAT
jgi:hypothetical protein